MFEFCPVVGCSENPTGTIIVSVDGYFDKLEAPRSV